MTPSRAAERQKQYRERLKLLNPEKFEATKKRNAERMKQNRKRISNCTNEEKENLRQIWRDYKKKTKNNDTERHEKLSAEEEEKIQPDANTENKNLKQQEDKKISKSKTNPELVTIAKSKLKAGKTNSKQENHIDPEENNISFPPLHDLKNLESKLKRQKTNPKVEKKRNQIQQVPSLFSLAFKVYFQLPSKRHLEKCKPNLDGNAQEHEKDVNCEGSKISGHNSEEEIEEMRQKWREYKRKSKEKQRENEEQLEKWREYKKKKNEENDLKQKLLAANKKLETENFVWKTTISSMKKKLKKNRQKLRRLQEKNEKIMKKISKLKNENYLNTTNTPIILTNDNKTPIIKSVASFINENLPNISVSEKERVKRKLMEHNVLINSVKDAYKNAKDLNFKQRIKSIIVNNEKVKKYKLKTKLASYIGLKGRIRQTHKIRKNSLLRDKLKEYFERDDVSRATAGKKEFKVHRKNKKQRRYLLNTLKILYKKYKSEGGNLSYSTFKKYRPFYVLSAKANKCNTCACIKHENLAMKVNVLKSMKMIDSQSLDEVLSLIVCNPESRECSYGECESCKNRKIQFQNNFSPNDTVSWYEWITKTHEYKDKNSEDTKTTKKVVKEMKTAPLKDLLEAFSQELEKFKRHSYNTFHQHREYRRCKKNLDDHSVLIHIDFSENYACKLSTEIQAMHFGASREQVTLHTGAMYFKEQEEPVTFCSLSANKYHGPEAIWAHMKPVLDFIKNEYPAITKAHFFSDGPSSQYKQKKNFHLFSVLMKKYGFTNSTWNFFVASHGKGAADGVGGAIKRKLDFLVCCGLDIADAKTAFKLLKISDTTVKVFFIPEDAIQMLTLELMPVPNTMMIHQIINTPSNNVILYRSLSCFCFLINSEDAECECFDLKKICLLKPETTTQEEEGGKCSAEKKGVTILSNIKNTEENRRYFDLQKYGPFNLIKMHPDSNIVIDKHEKPKFENSNNLTYVKSGNKSKIKKQTRKRKLPPKKMLKPNKICKTDDHKQPGPSGIKNKNKRKRRPSIDSITSISDIMSEYSDSDIIDCSDLEELMNENATTPTDSLCNKGKGVGKKSKENEVHKKDREKEDKKHTAREQDNDVDVLINGKKMTITEYSEEKDKDQQLLLELKNKCLVSETQEENSAMYESYKLNDAVLVRYLIRKKWKYFIGFIGEIINDEITYFSINFLKTMRLQQQLSFIVTKRKDIDKVPEILIVKKIDIQKKSGNEKEYYLCNDEDAVYFD